MIILHNPNSKVSREFIAALGDDHGHEIIDFYGPDRAKYSGPAPAAFPAIVVEMLGRTSLIEQPDDWAAVEAAVTGLLLEAKAWAKSQVNKQAYLCLGDVASPYGPQTAVYQAKEQEAREIQATIDAGRDSRRG